MKSRFPLAIACAALLAASTASAAEMPRQDRQTEGQATMMRDANLSEQASTDMSYGGVADARTASGSVGVRPGCSQPQCDLFFGR